MSAVPTNTLPVVNNTEPYNEVRSSLQLCSIFVTRYPYVSNIFDSDSKITRLIFFSIPLSCEFNSAIKIWDYICRNEISVLRHGFLPASNASVVNITMNVPRECFNLLRGPAIVYNKTIILVVSKQTILPNDLHPVTTIHL